MKKWIINTMVCLKEDGDLKDFVVNVNWTRIAKERIKDKEYQATAYDSISFSKNDVIIFVPYEDLTYEIVCGWLDASIDVEALDLNLDAQIESQVNPPLVVLPLPWEVKAN